MPEGCDADGTREYAQARKKAVSGFGFWGLGFRVLRRPPPRVPPSRAKAAASTEAATAGSAASLRAIEAKAEGDVPLVLPCAGADRC